MDHQNRLVRPLVGLNLGLLGASVILPMGRTLSASEYSETFPVAALVSSWVARWSGSDPSGYAGQLGLLTQHLIAAIVLGAVITGAVVLTRAGDATLGRTAWYLAAVNPWLVLALLMVVPRELSAAVIGYAWLAASIAANLVAAYLYKVERRLRPSVVMLVAASAISWVAFVLSIGPVMDVAAIAAGLAAAALAVSAWHSLGGRSTIDPRSALSSERAL